MSTAGDPGNFYIWRASDDFAIHLSIQVVTQLNAQISRAGVQTKASSLRGILLGRVTEEPFRATIIEDLQLLPSSDDPDAHHSDEDALFEMACLKARNSTDRRVLGFFRCRRDGRLNMSPRDVEIFSRLFSETGNVALLIQTSRRGNESDAALFYWDRGGAHPRDFGFGFPFDAGQLVSGHPGWRYPDPLAVSPAVPALDGPESQEPEWTAAPAPPQSAATAWHVPADPPSGGREIRWSRLVPTIVIAVVAVSVMQLVSKKTVSAASLHPSAIESPASAETAVTPTPMAAPNGDGLGLRVTLAAHQLEIRWSRDSKIIASSDRGVMKITESGITESVVFDQSQLRDGYVAYIPKTNDVGIRLEVTAKDGATTVESIRSVAIP
jgi:hypothetical protein